MKKRSLLELNRKTVQEFKAADKTPIVVVLDNVRSALNVGAAFRTLDGFAATELALCGITAVPPHREILKTAIGATASVDWKYFENTLDAIRHYREQGYCIASVEQADNSTQLHQVPFTEKDKVAIVMGNEVKGVDQAVIDGSDLCVEIPQFGTKHSFNISVCLGIVLWEVFKKVAPEKL